MLRLEFGEYFPRFIKNIQIFFLETWNQVIILKSNYILFYADCDCAEQEFEITFLCN